MSMLKMLIKWMFYKAGKDLSYTSFHKNLHNYLFLCIYNYRFVWPPNNLLEVRRTYLHVQVSDSVCIAKLIFVF